MKNIRLNSKIFSYIAIFGFMVMPLFSMAVVAPLNYCEDFEDTQLQENGWTGTFTWSGNNSCSGSYAMYDYFDINNTAGTLVSPVLGKIRGAHYDVLIGFNYLVNGGAVNFGTIDVQYATSLSGPWTTVYTINSSNHIVSNSCAHVDVPRFVISSANKGLDIYVRFVVTWATGVYDVIIDDIFIGDLCEDQVFKTPACWGITLVDYTWYRGLGQWMWLKAKVGGGVGTYVWSIVGPGTLITAGAPYSIYLKEATGPVTVKVKITFGTYCYYEGVFFDILYNDIYWAGTPSDPWWLHICEGGVDKIETYNDALQKVCFGNATLGYCVPKTTPEIVESFNVEIYPNPSNGEFVLDIANADNETNVEVYNTNGVLVFNGSYTNATREMLDLSNLSVGVYFVRVYSGNEMYTDKLIIK